MTDHELIAKLTEALEKLLEAEWMVSHDWGGDRKAVLDQSREALALARQHKDETTDKFQILCPKCGHRWPLTYGQILIDSCESDGIYGASVECPNCEEKADIYDY